MTSRWAGLILRNKYKVKGHRHNDL